MTAILRRLDYRFRPRLRRETCKRCWRENAVGFSVPNDVWRAVVPARHIENVLCLTCFDRYATARGVDWTARGCDLYAVSGVRFTATSRSRPSSSPDTRCTARPWWAWRSASRSCSSASWSSWSRSATCRCPSACGTSLPLRYLSRLGLFRRAAEPSVRTTEGKHVFLSAAADAAGTIPASKGNSVGGPPLLRLRWLGRKDGPLPRGSRKPSRLSGQMSRVTCVTPGVFPLAIWGAARFVLAASPLLKRRNEFRQTLLGDEVGHGVLRWLSSPRTGSTEPVLS